MNIKGWNEFVTWVENNVDSVEDRYKLYSMATNLMRTVRDKENIDKVMCSCKQGRYCNVECNL